MWNFEYVPRFDVSRINEVSSLLVSSFFFFFVSWPFLSSETDILGSPFKRGQQYYYWRQWRVHHFQSWPRGRRGRGWGGLTGWKRGRNRQTDHTRGGGDTWTAEDFIISHICSLVFMEGSKLFISKTGQKMNTFTGEWKLQPFCWMFLGFFLPFRLKCQLLRKFQC